MPRRSKNPWVYKKRKKTSKSSSKTAKNKDTENVAFDSQDSGAEVLPETSSNVITPTVLASNLSRIARTQETLTDYEVPALHTEPSSDILFSNSALKPPEVNIEVKKEIIKETKKSDGIKSESTEPSHKQMCSTALLPAFGLLESQKAVDTEPVKIKKELSHRFNDTPSTTATESEEEDYCEIIAAVKPTKKFNLISPNPTDCSDDIIMVAESVTLKEVEEPEVSIFKPDTDTSIELHSQDSESVLIKEEIEVEGGKSDKLCDTAPSSPAENVEEEDMMIRNLTFPEEMEFLRIKTLFEKDHQRIQTNREDTSSPIRYTGDVIFSTGIVPFTNETQKQSIFSDYCVSSEIKKYLDFGDNFKTFDINNCCDILDIVQKQIQDIKLHQISEDDALKSLINAIRNLDLEVRNHELYFGKTCKSPSAKSDNTSEVSPISESYQQINSGNFNENSNLRIINPLANELTNKYKTSSPLTREINSFKRNSPFILNSNELNGGQLMANFSRSLSSAQPEILKTTNSVIDGHSNFPKSISNKRKSSDEHERSINNTNILLIPEHYGMPNSKSQISDSQKYQNHVSVDQINKRTRIQNPKISSLCSGADDNMITLPTYNNQDASNFISESIAHLINPPQDPTFNVNNVSKPIQNTIPRFGPIYGSDNILEISSQMTEPSTNSGQIRTLQYPQQQDMFALRYPSPSQLDIQNRSRESQVSQFHQVQPPVSQQKVSSNPSKRLNQDEPLISTEIKKKRLDLREYLNRKATTKMDKNREIASQHNIFETNFMSNLQPSHSEIAKNNTISFSDIQLSTIATVINDIKNTNFPNKPNVNSFIPTQQNYNASPIIHNYGNTINSNTNGTNSHSFIPMNSSINLPISNFPSCETIPDNNPRPIPIHLQSSIINDTCVKRSPILSDPRLNKSSPQTRVPTEKRRGSISLVPNQSVSTPNISSAVTVIPSSVEHPQYIQQTGFSKTQSTSDNFVYNGFNSWNCEVPESSGFSQVCNNRGDSNNSKYDFISVSLVPKDVKNNIGRNFIESNYIYLIIIEWNAAWFGEFENMRISPPILPAELSQVRNTYKDSAEYYNIYLKLLLMESWYKIYTSWKEYAFLNPITLEYEVRGEHRAKIAEFETKNHYNKYLIELFVKTSEIESVPKESGTVLLQFGVVRTMLPIRKIGMLGYVTKVMSRPFFASTDAENEAYKALQSNDGKVFKYKITVFTVFKSDYIDTKKLVQLNKLINIRKILQQHDALKNVSDSSLCQVILNPITSEHKISYNIPAGQNDVSGIVADLCEKILRDDHEKVKSPLLALINTFRDRFNKMKIVSDIINEIHVTKPQAKIIICSKRESELSKIGVDLNKHGHHTVFVSKDKIPELQKFSLLRLAEKELKNELVEVLNEEKFLKLKRAKEQILQKSSVILLPLLGCFEEIRPLIKTENIVCCILDEAHCCTETESIVPLTLEITKYVLLGNKDALCDVSYLTESYDFNRSLFNRASL